MELEEQLREYLAKLDTINELEKQLSEYKKAVTQLDAELAEKMQEKDVGKLEVEGIEFKPVNEIQFSLDGELAGQRWDNPIFFKWLRDHQLEDIIKIKETVHYQTRVKVLKELKEEGKSLPDFCKVGFHNRLKFNKSEVKRRTE